MRSRILFDWVEEIAEQERAWRTGGAASWAAGLRSGSRRQRGDAMFSASRDRGLAACRRAASGRAGATRSPPRTSSSAAASIETTARSRLVTLAQVALEIHRSAKGRARARRCGRLPTRARAHRHVWNLPSAAPVDQTLLNRVVLVLPELPERLAGAGAAAAVNAVRDGLRDALRLDHQIGQPVGELVRVATQ